MKVAWLVLVAGCGRIGFDPSGVPPNDGRLPGDGHAANGDSGSGSTIDAPVSACVAAMPQQIQTGVLAHVSTCTDPDKLDACGPAGTKEVILEFIPPATTNYTARAYDHGTTNVTMASTTRFDQNCQPSNICAGVLGVGYTQGVPVYFVLEASSGGCADVDFLVD